MTTRGPVFSGLFFCFAASMCLAGEPSLPISKFAGKWTVSEIVGYGEISGGIPAAKVLLGKTLSISSSQIEFNGESCRPHDGFTVRAVEAAPVLNEYYGINIEYTGLPARTLLLDSSNCTPIFVMDKYHVVFGDNGVILRAVRSRARRAP